jgi:hypothetical protein
MAAASIKRKDLYLQSISTRHESIPSGDAVKALVDGNHGTVAGAIACDAADCIVGAVVATYQCCNSDLAAAPTPLHGACMRVLAVLPCRKQRGILWDTYYASMASFPTTDA